MVGSSSICCYFLLIFFIFYLYLFFVFFSGSCMRNEKTYLLLRMLISLSATLAVLLPQRSLQ